MAADSPTSELKRAILEFEFQVDVPVAVDDPDKRDEWKTSVNDSFDEMKKLVEAQRKEIHTKLFAEIASQDESERPKIEELRQADERIGEFLDVVKAHLAAFAIGADGGGAEPDVENQVLELRDASHRLTASLLAQEEAVTSWFAESFDRTK